MSTGELVTGHLRGEPRERIHIPKQSGRGFAVAAGELIRVIDTEGEQVADFVALSPDRSLRFSTDQTRDVIRTIYATSGHSLYAKTGEKLLTIVADEVGRHDMLYAWCRPEFYKRLFNEDVHPNCHDNLLGALRPFGVTDAELPMPFNIFQNVEIHHDGKMEVHPPRSKAGDSILLKAERALIVAISACSVVKSRCNGFNPSSIDVEIYAPVNVG